MQNAFPMNELRKRNGLAGARTESRQLTETASISWEMMAELQTSLSGTESQSPEMIQSWKLCETRISKRARATETLYARSELLRRLCGKEGIGEEGIGEA